MSLSIPFGQVSSFGLIGAVGFITDGGVLTVMHEALGIALLPARLCSFAVAVTVTWSLNRRLTFPGRNDSRALAQWLRYTVVNSVGGLLNLALFLYLVHSIPAFSEIPLVPLAIASLVAMVLNFLGSKYIAFRESHLRLIGDWGASSLSVDEVDGPDGKRPARPGAGVWAGRRPGSPLCCLMWLAFSLGPLAFGLLALWIGKDLSWDLLNYHYYNPHALLTWRYDLDVAPAQLQSFFNPLIDVPFYLIIKAMPAWVLGFSAGSIHGLNFSLVFFITWRVVEHPSPMTRGFVSLGSAVVGCSAPAFMGELGGLSHDNTLSVLVLASIAFLLKAVHPPDAGARRWYFSTAAAGLLMGAATGLKLTNAPFALGSAVALIAAGSLRGRRTRVLLIYGLTGALAAIMLLAPWMWFLWERFGNPMFPLFNDVFASPAAAQSAFRDTRFTPDGLWEFLLWPLVFSADSLKVWEVKHQDYRFAALWFAGMIYAITMAARRVWRGTKGDTRTDAVIDRSAADFLIVFVLASFLLWMLGYSIYRYLMPLELIAPLVLGLLIARLGLRREILTGLLIVLGIATVIGLHAPNQRRHAWEERYFAVDTSAVDKPDETLVLMLGHAPMGYVVPEFPSGVRFLRPDGSLNLRDRHELLEKIRSTLQRHEGPIFVIFDASEESAVLPGSLDRLGLAALPGDCRPLATNVPDDLRICTAVQRNAVPAPG